MAIHSSILAWRIPGSPGHRNLASCGPKGGEELDMTEAT